MIDLRSDTVTRPCANMRQAMASAEVGDDVYGEDPTVASLESETAALLGHEAGLFAPSGTQANLIALMNHCGRGDEYIVGHEAHTYKFEGGGAATLGSIQPQPIDFAEDATLPLGKILAAIKPDDIHFARTRLVCLEDTQAGQPVPLNYLADVRALARRHQLALHLDGARLFNAAVAQNVSPATIGSFFDSVSVCLSKGLGAPIGSVLVGSKEFVTRAKRLRKMLGGGMRQAGIVAAAGRYALTHNIDRLAEDHKHAELIGEALSKRLLHLGINGTARSATNMVHITCPKPVLASLLSHLQTGGVNVQRPRWVLHKDVSRNDVDHVLACIANFTG